VERHAIQVEGRRDEHAIKSELASQHPTLYFFFHFQDRVQEIRAGPSSCSVVVGWFRGSRDAYLEAYEVDDEEFWKVLEEVSDDDPTATPTGI
jgi:hypothetical protein